MDLGSVDWGILASRMSLGGLLGLALGFLMKKVLKLTLIVIGVLLLVLLAMQNLEFIHINWGVLEKSYNSFMQHPDGLLGMLAAWASRLDTAIPVAGGFLIGFMIGLKLG